jgi:hypothetical protein
MDYGFVVQSEKLPLPLYEQRYVPDVPLYVTFSVDVDDSPAATLLHVGELNEGSDLRSSPSNAGSDLRFSPSNEGSAPRGRVSPEGSEPRGVRASLFSLCHRRTKLGRRIRRKPKL